MAQNIEDWVENHVSKLRDKSVRWLSEHHFFRDPIRPIYSDPTYFFSPADGIILYQRTVMPHECVLDVKGKLHSLQAMMRDDSFDQECLVIGIFMTFYDVHVNRIPYSGRLCYKELPPIDSFNYPMLEVEKSIIDELHVNVPRAAYLYNNQRILNRVYSSELRQWYYILQIADYDVDAILPFERKQNSPVSQNARFSQIRYGSQVDLIVPISNKCAFVTTQDVGMHVEAGIDSLIQLVGPLAIEHQ